MIGAAGVGYRGRQPSFGLLFDQTPIRPSASERCGLEMLSLPGQGNAECSRRQERGYRTNMVPCHPLRYVLSPE